MELRVRLLEQRHPELTRILAVSKDGLALLIAWDERVHAHLDPLTELVQQECDEPLVDALPRINPWLDERPEQVARGDRRHRAEQVAIAELALRDVARGQAVLDQIELPVHRARDLVRAQPAHRLAVVERLAGGLAGHVQCRRDVGREALIGPLRIAW